MIEPTRACRRPEGCDDPWRCSASEPKVAPCGAAYEAPGPDMQPVPCECVTAGSDEPYGIVYEWDIGTSVVQRSFSPAPYNGREPDRCVTVYTRPASPQPAAGADEQDAVRALAAFGAAILNRMRRSWGNDIDGCDAEEMGLKAGVLVRQTIDEPCCETCECAEVADFPLECNRILTIALPILDAAIAAQEKQK